jgi:hypothetical protein
VTESPRNGNNHGAVRDYPLVAFALSRVFFGLLLLARPGAAGKAWFGSDRLSAPTTSLLRSVGGRDVALGLGLVNNDGPKCRWLAAGVVSDVADVAATTLVRDRFPRKNYLIGFFSALAYAVVGIGLAIRESRAG